MTWFLKFITGSTLATGHVLLRGVIVRDLWYWFAVPLGLPALSLAHAIGLSGMISYITFAIRQEPENGKPFFQILVSLVLTGYIVGLIAWGMGWITAQFM